MTVHYSLTPPHESYQSHLIHRIQHIRIPGTGTHSGDTNSGDTILITAIVTTPPASTGLVKGVLALSGRCAAQLGIVAGDKVEW